MIFLFNKEFIIIKKFHYHEIDTLFVLLIYIMSFKNNFLRRIYITDFWNCFQLF